MPIQSLPESVQLEQVPLAILPLPMLLLSEDGRITRANLLAQETLCKSERQLNGLQLPDLFAPVGEIERLMALLTPYGGGASDHQLCMRANGMPISLHLGMHHTGIAAIFVPEAQRAEVERHAKRHEMAEAVARIALEMAHEVKNPLAALRGASQWLSEQPLPGDAREAVGQILTGVDRIKERIDAFLQVGPRAAVQMERTNIHKLIHEVSQQPDGIYVSHVFDPSLPEIMAHTNRLQQALENLWQNAVEAAERKIEWQTRMAPLAHLAGYDGQIVEISITNDGATIPAQLRDRLFEPYVTGKTRGSGLGLALVERVMLEHGGKVNVKSEQGRTTLTLHLPVQRAATENKEKHEERRQ